MRGYFVGGFRILIKGVGMAKYCDHALTSAERYPEPAPERSKHMRLARSTKPYLSHFTAGSED
jgi:hypothetical protein